MKKFILSLLIGVGLTPLFAQIEISMRLNRGIYVQFEPVYAYVTLRNNTGKPLLFGKDPRLQGFILFELRDSSGRLAPKLPGREISMDGLVIRSGESKSVVIPLNLYYDLERLGTYWAHAYVSHNMLRHEYKSRDVPFIVSRGAEIWKKRVGMPDLSGKNRFANQERVYSIRVLSESRRQYYYLVVEDDKRVYGVVRVGEVIGNQEIKAEIDMLSRIHLLIPMSPRVFHYLSFGLDGSNTINTFHKTTRTIPMLYRDDRTGIVTLRGGVEARPGVDFQLHKPGSRTGSQLLKEEEISNANRSKLYRNEGLVDLGKGLAQ